MRNYLDPTDWSSASNVTPNYFDPTGWVAESNLPTFTDPVSFTPVATTAGVGMSGWLAAAGVFVLLLAFSERR